MKILVTGSSGFIGQNMVNDLSKNHDIITYDIIDHKYHPKIKGLDWIIHLGAISSTVESDIEKIMKLNYDYSVWLLKQAIKYNVNFQWASSASIYGPDTKVFLENSNPDPRSPYAWSKYLFERHIEKLFPLQIIVQGFRYFNVYGSHEDHKGNQASPYHKFAKEAKELGKITIFEGSENFKRDFVPVETVIDVHKKFFYINQSGIWNVGTGIPRSFMEVAKSFNVKIDVVPMPENIKRNYQSYTCADMTKMKNTI